MLRCTFRVLFPIHFNQQLFRTFNHSATFDIPDLTISNDVILRDPRLRRCHLGNSWELFLLFLSLSWLKRTMTVPITILLSFTEKTVPPIPGIPRLKRKEQRILMAQRKESPSPETNEYKDRDDSKAEQKRGLEEETATEPT